MQVILCQLDIVWEDKQANIEKVRQLLADQQIHPGAMIVLPEMFATGFSMNLSVTAEPDDRPTEQFLQQMAVEHQSYIVAGVVNRDASGLGRNEAVVFDPEGAELTRYAKMYPMTIAGEAQCHVPGQEVVTFTRGHWSIAPLICYDLRFPEVFRDAVQRGTQLFVVIANFPALRQDHWVTLLRARAIENQAYVVGVNRCGRDPHHSYAGGSMVVDPRGQVLADLGDAEGAMGVEVHLQLLQQYRQEFPALGDMRAVPR